MDEKQIVTELLRYIDDSFYNYAVMVTGEWGIGKTYFAKGVLKRAIEEHEKDAFLKNENYKEKQIEYITLYGCKTADDISAAFAMALTHGTLKQRGVTDFYDSILPRFNEQKEKITNALKRIASEIAQKYSSNKLIFDVTSEVFTLKDYIFIVDDLERCDCNINEVFGFLNQLVEHKEAKMIIFANEAEISDYSKSEGNHDFQYYYSLDDRVDWSDKESNILGGNRALNAGKINIKELERRRKLLFPDKNNNDEYHKIKEKLVGMTLEYNPLFEDVISGIIENSKIDDDIKTELKLREKNFIDYMNAHNHHNLRTFQFFLSKMEFLIKEIEKLEIDNYYIAAVKKAVVCDTFLCAVEYKSNYENPGDPYSIVYSERNHISNAIETYVRKGSFDTLLYKKEILDFVKGLKDSVTEDDPLEKLYSLYFVNSENWCVEKISELLENLRGDRYSVRYYAKILIILVRLDNMGFSKEYLNEAKELMINNIRKNSKSVNRINEDLFWVDDKETKVRVLEVIISLNSIIANQSENEKGLTILDILQSKEWVKGLEEFCSMNNRQYFLDMPIFYMAPADIWYRAIHKTEPRGIHAFRQWLYRVYPRTEKVESFYRDMDTLRELYGKLDENAEEDLIKKNSIIWLKHQIEEIFKNNSVDLEVEEA